MTITLSNSFEVPTDVDATWRTLLDVERVVMCLPGAQLESMDGDTFTGRVKIKLGPIAMSFKGIAEFTERDEAAHRAVLAANGREVAGSGTASAVMTMQVAAAASGPGSIVTVGTELAITGRAAKLGRGVIPDVAGRLVDQFAAALTAQLAAAPTAAAQAPTGEAGEGGPYPDSAGAGDAFQVLGGAAPGRCGTAVRRVAAPQWALLAALLVMIWLLGRGRRAEARDG